MLSLKRSTRARIDSESPNRHLTEEQKQRGREFRKEVGDRVRQRCLDEGRPDLAAKVKIDTF